MSRRSCSPEAAGFAAVAQLTAKRRRDNRLSPSPAQQRRWADLPGHQPHGDVVQVNEDSWTGRPAVYRHVAPASVELLRRRAASSLLTVWTVDPAAPRLGDVHLNAYTMTAVQAIELIGGAARGRWVEEVVHIEPATDLELPPAEQIGPA